MDGEADFIYDLEKCAADVDEHFNNFTFENTPREKIKNNIKQSLLETIFGCNDY